MSNEQLDTPSPNAIEYHDVDLSANQKPTMRERLDTAVGAVLLATGATIYVAYGDAVVEHHINHTDSPVVQLTENVATAAAKSEAAEKLMDWIYGVPAPDRLSDTSTFDFSTHQPDSTPTSSTPEPATPPTLPDFAAYNSPGIH